MKHIEIDNFVTLKSVEYAHSRAIVEQKRNNTAFAAPELAITKVIILVQS